MAPGFGDLEPSRELCPVMFSHSKLRAIVLTMSVIGISVFVTAGSASAAGEVRVSNASPLQHEDPTGLGSW